MSTGPGRGEPSRWPACVSWARPMWSWCSPSRRTCYGVTGDMASAHACADEVEQMWADQTPHPLGPCPRRVPAGGEPAARRGTDAGRAGRPRRPPLTGARPGHAGDQRAVHRDRRGARRHGRGGTGADVVHPGGRRRAQHPADGERPRGPRRSHRPARAGRRRVRWPRSTPISMRTRGTRTRAGGRASRLASRPGSAAGRPPDVAARLHAEGLAGSAAARPAHAVGALPRPAAGRRWPRRGRLFGCSARSSRSEVDGEVRPRPILHGPAGRRTGGRRRVGHHRSPHRRAVARC